MGRRSRKDLQLAVQLVRIHHRRHHGIGQDADTQEKHMVSKDPVLLLQGAGVHHLPELVGQHPWTVGQNAPRVEAGIHPQDLDQPEQSGIHLLPLPQEAVERL